MDANNPLPPVTGKEKRYLGQMRTAARETQTQKALEASSPDVKMGLEKAKAAELPARSVRTEDWCWQEGRCL